ncbi:uncharacterized protein LOC118266447 isoform X2 [Spodoptera frugiperda]|uniref:SFRICE_008935 n=1 Tax=Spodoptera frugiperda TaxID=7108 RepID=A0A2H1VLK2_SPOFR|nr:uncharacterized protein LOC118266447 isoform X2 [Spodoptera frugiperda]
MSSPPKVSFYVGCMNTINTIAHLLMGGTIFLTFAVSDIYTPSILLSQPLLFEAHVVTTMIGVTLLCSQAILSVNPYAGFEDNFMYPKKSKSYWIIQIIGSVLVLCGACIGVAHVSEMIPTINDTPLKIEDWPYPTPGIRLKHFSSDHGIIGFLVLLLAAASLVGAIANLAIKDKLSSAMKASYTVVGTITILLAYIAVSIKFGDFNKLLDYIEPDHEIGTFSLGISFAVLSLSALLIMMGARVFVTRSINF